MRILLQTLTISACVLTLFNCGKKTEPAERTSFTKADSVTEYYLALKDSIHRTWNIMINDDNQKIKAMRNLLHELEVTHPEDKARYAVLADRIEQLSRMRFTQKSMSNIDVIIEYDAASRAVIRDLVNEARSKTQFAYNSTLQILVEQIHQATGRIDIYRQQYDSIVYTYNEFVETNFRYLNESGEDGSSLDKKPLFQMTSE